MRVSRHLDGRDRPTLHAMMGHTRQRTVKQENKKQNKKHSTESLATTWLDGTPASRRAYALVGATGLALRTAASRSLTTTAWFFLPASLISTILTSASLLATSSAALLPWECSASNALNSASFCALYASISFRASSRASLTRFVRTGLLAGLGCHWRWMGYIHSRAIDKVSSQQTETTTDEYENKNNAPFCTIWAAFCSACRVSIGLLVATAPHCFVGMGCGRTSSRVWMPWEF